MLAFLAFGIGVGPWTVRNIQNLHEPLPIVDSMQYHLLVGNNPQATGGPLPDETIRGVLKEPLPVSEDKSQRSAERSKILGGLAWDYLRSHPAESYRVRLQAGCYFFLGQEFFTKGTLQQPGAEDAQKAAPEWLRNSAPAILAGSLLAMLLLAALGLALELCVVVYRCPCCPGSGVDPIAVHIQSCRVVVWPTLALRRCVADVRSVCHWLLAADHGRHVVPRVLAEADRCRRESGRGPWNWGRNQ